MRGGQGLHAGDAGDYVMGEGDAPAGAHALQDAQGAVVEGGIAPDEEGAPLVLAQVLRDQALVERGAGSVPVVHRRTVIGGPAVALGIGRFDETIGAALDVAIADAAAQAQEPGFRVALVEGENGVRRLQRPDALDRQVLRIARADADDVDVSQVSASGPGASRRRPPWSGLGMEAAS